MRAALLFFCPIALVSLACSGDGDGPGGAGGTGSSGGPPSLPCDVDAVLGQHCRSCHDAAPKYGAPMPLVTYADLHAPAASDASREVYELVAELIHDDLLPMPPPPNARLGAADAAVIDAWAAAGAPAGPGGCGG